MEVQKMTNMTSANFAVCFLVVEYLMVFSLHDRGKRNLMILLTISNQQELQCVDKSFEKLSDDCCNETGISLGIQILSSTLGT